MIIPDRLYVIGNGFDLHHGLKSHYRDFKTYLQDKGTNDLIENLEKYFGGDSLWSDFEETLANLDTEQIIDECSNYLVSYSAEGWSEAYHHDYQYEVQKRIDLITEELKKNFTEWIFQLKMPPDSADKKIELKVESLFINFNYTETLEKLYNVSSKNILYIHNKAVNNNSTLILGHSRDPKLNQTLEELYNDEDSDVRVREGNRILDLYFEKTYKSTQKIIEDNKPFFDTTKEVKEIYVLGHSLSKVDITYFEELIKQIDTTTVKWKISIYSRKELVHHSEVMEKLGIDIDLIEFDTIKSIDTKQLRLFPKDKF